MKICQNKMVSNFRKARGFGRRMGANMNGNGIQNAYNSNVNGNGIPNQYNSNVYGMQNGAYNGNDGPAYTQAMGDGQPQASLQEMAQEWADPRNRINESQSLDQIEGDTALDIDVAETGDGTRLITVTDRDEPNGAQATIRMPAQQEQEPEPDECEFPVQAVQFQRTVNVTNTDPVVVERNTDVCGNIVSYTEQMTRTMRAGDWTPIDPSQLSGPVGEYEQYPNGSIRYEHNGNVRLANSPGLFNGANVVSQQLVGGRRSRQRRSGRARPMHQNQNAYKMGQAMHSYRSA